MPESGNEHEHNQRHDPGHQPGVTRESAAERRRAPFLRELSDAKELRDRVQPRRAKVARIRQAMRMRVFRW